MSATIISHSPQQTMDFAARLAHHLRGGEVIALDGPLGAGKTCFVRGLAAGLGIDPTLVSSPTFILCQEYSRNEKSGGGPLVHIDAYRLSGPDDLHAIGWEELVTDASAIVVVEWAARIERALPPHCTRINFKHAGDTHRRLTISAPPELLAALQLKDE